MVDINRHKFLLLQILKDIFSDIELADSLGFKGGTALMFLHGLPRFSVDLDFNLINEKAKDLVYERIHDILLKYGTIHDEAKKFFGILFVLNYGAGERKLKVEVSNRLFDDEYEIANLLGITMRVMVPADMFAHKLCALFDRKSMAPRDIFDCWFFAQKQTPINRKIVEFRMKMNLDEYLGKCIIKLESLKDNILLHGIGELTDDEMKIFVRTKMRNEVIRLLNFYREFPILKED